MAAPPSHAEFHKSDFPSSGLGTPEALEKFFLQLNNHLKGTRNALSGALTLADNLNADVKTVTITTPSTDWAALKLSGSWVAFGGTQASPAYRVDRDGHVYLKGLVKGGSVGSTINKVALPAWAEQLVFPAMSNNGSDLAADVRLQTSGFLQLQTGGTSWLSLDSIHWQPSNPVPGLLSCFPVSVATKVQKPIGVVVANCQDNAAGAVPPALGAPSWTLTGTGKLQITNLPGLVLGRTYTLTLLVLGG